jgi:hypothetical protein
MRGIVESSQSSAVGSSESSPVQSSPVGGVGSGRGVSESSRLRRRHRGVACG